MRPHALPVLTLAVLASACARTAPPAAAELPEIAAFRAALADPARHPLRQGLALDQGQLRGAVAAFRDGHRELLGRAFRASLDALPAGALPGDGYRVVAETKPEDAAAIADGTGFLYTLHPDATQLARTAISMFAPVLASEAGMSVADIGSWLGFFAAAAPELRRCDRTVVCVDYGGLDVFVVTLVEQGSGWGASSVAWRQRRLAPPP